LAAEFREISSYVSLSSNKINIEKLKNIFIVITCLHYVFNKSKYNLTVGGIMLQERIDISVLFSTFKNQIGWRTVPNTDQKKVRFKRQIRTDKK
jgi:hypothetical protein